MGIELPYWQDGPKSTGRDITWSVGATNGV